MKTMSKISAAAFMSLTAVFLSGCDDNTASKTVTMNGSDKCSVDVISGKPDAIVYVKRGKVEIQGWAFDDATQVTAQNLQMRLTGAQGEATAKDPVRFDRPDVAKAYNNKELTNSGYNFVLDTTALVPGAYAIALEIPKGNAMYVCQSKKLVVIM
ncbi:MULTISPECIES: hypothetical protein [Pseudomonas]|uniref:hypothetical protein n=1 Tax=Pseudomonas TaxID=286 RepID=UPI001B32C251|nr:MULTISPECIES: hypothetical protein [Pseudomonas]MBP5948275.1 hypothetical protein [Pseudomonas sp. P9(2020)]MBP5958559.1 hypothetical protein [Pseudomonas anatoliensis]MBZ9560642.1 hypothetical protein [Pseudomonas sp. P116]